MRWVRAVHLIFWNTMPYMGSIPFPSIHSWLAPARLGSFCLWLFLIEWKNSWNNYINNNAWTGRNGGNQMFSEQRTTESWFLKENPSNSLSLTLVDWKELLVVPPWSSTERRWKAENPNVPSVTSPINILPLSFMYIILSENNNFKASAALWNFRWN